MSMCVGKTFPMCFLCRKQNCVRIELCDACKLVVSASKAGFLSLGRQTSLKSSESERNWFQSRHWTSRFVLTSLFALFVCPQPAPAMPSDRPENLVTTRAASAHAKRAWPGWPVIDAPEATSRAALMSLRASVSTHSCRLSKCQLILFLSTEPRVISMNMPQNTAPESYYSDQTEVRPKSRDGKSPPLPVKGISKPSLQK